ncbi:MAG TPA: hypothetical protein VIY49_01670 [Bryobacteraceae bacterium]
MDTTIVTIGNADKGGYWFAVAETDFQDGFETAWDAAQEAMAKYPNYEIYYWEWDSARHRYVAIPGETSVRWGARRAPTKLPLKRGGFLLGTEAVLFRYFPCIAAVQERMWVWPGGPDDDDEAPTGKRSD